MVSKAAVRSRRIRMELLPSSACIRMSLDTLSNAVSVLFFLAKSRLEFVKDSMTFYQLQELVRDNLFKDFR